MKQATTPTVLIRTSKDLSSCTEIRIALTRQGDNEPYVIKSLTNGDLEVETSVLTFKLSQKETNDLKGTVIVDMRVVTETDTVVGFKRGYLQVNESFDRAII